MFKNKAKRNCFNSAFYFNYLSIPRAYSLTIFILLLSFSRQFTTVYLQFQPVHPKGDQSWVFIGRIDAEAETPIFWPPCAKSWLIGKDPDAGRDWGQEEKGTTEDEMAGWHHRLDGHEFEQTPGVCDGQGSLVCCDSWGRKESDTTEWLNWLTDLQFTLLHW